MKSSHLLVTAFTVAILCALPMHADAVAIPSIASVQQAFQLQFSGVCGDCPGVGTSGNATGTFTQDALANTSQGPGYATMSGNLIYQSGWFEITAYGNLQFQGTDVFAPVSGDRFDFVSYAASVVANPIPGKEHARCGGVCSIPLGSGTYVLQLRVTQGSSWTLDLFPQKDRTSAAPADFGPTASLTPSGPPSAVPEPSTWAMFGTGAAALLFARRRRSN